MSAKRRKMGMSRKERFLRAIGLWSAFLMLISCFALIFFLVLDITGLNIIEREEGARTYLVQFQSEERLLLDMTYKRGEKIDKPANPTHSKSEYYKYTFRGWDITGDNTPDIIPSHAYYEFLAVAVFQKTQIKTPPKSSSQPDKSSANEVLSYEDELLDNIEVEAYGA